MVFKAKFYKTLFAIYYKFYLLHIFLILFIMILFITDLLYLLSFYLQVLFICKMSKEIKKKNLEQNVMKDAVIKSLLDSLELMKLEVENDSLRILRF